MSEISDEVKNLVDDIRHAANEMQMRKLAQLAINAALAEERRKFRELLKVAEDLNERLAACDQYLEDCTCPLCSAVTAFTTFKLQNGLTKETP